MKNGTKVPYSSQEIIHEGTLYKIDIDDTTHGTIEQGGAITYKGPITINWNEDKTIIESITKNIWKLKNRGIKIKTEDNYVRYK